jgi:hypothetical protein
MCRFRGNHLCADAHPGYPASNSICLLALLVAWH